MEYGICKAHRRQADVLFLVWMKKDKVNINILKDEELRNC